MIVKNHGQARFYKRMANSARLFQSLRAGPMLPTVQDADSAGRLALMIFRKCLRAAAVVYVSIEYRLFDTME